MTLSKAKRGVILANLRSIIADILAGTITPQVWDMTVSICRSNLFPAPVATPPTPCSEALPTPLPPVTEPDPVAMVVPDVVPVAKAKASGSASSKAPSA